MANGALVNIDSKTIITRYLNGELSDDIAKSLNVTRQGLSWHLRKHAEEDWKEAQIILAIERKEQAQKAMDVAGDALALARAREQLKSAQWDLERVLKRIYGPSQEVTGKDGGPFQVQIVRFGDTIEGDAAVQDAEVLTNKDLPTS